MFYVSYQHDSNELTNHQLFEQFLTKEGKRERQITHRYEVTEHIDELALACPFCQELVENVEFLGPNFSIEDHHWEIRAVDSRELMIILVQVWLRPVSGYI